MTNTEITVISRPSTPRISQCPKVMFNGEAHRETLRYLDSNGIEWVQIRRMLNGRWTDGAARASQVRSA